MRTLLKTRAQFAAVVCNYLLVHAVQMQQQFCLWKPEYLRSNTWNCLAAVASSTTVFFKYSAGIHPQSALLIYSPKQFYHRWQNPADWQPPSTGCLNATTQGKKLAKAHGPARRFWFSIHGVGRTCSLWTFTATHCLWCWFLASATITLMTNNA